VTRTVTPNALFVYGTLMRGQSNHALIQSALRIETASVRGRMVGLPEGYPALIDGDGIVHGELCFFEDLGPILPEVDEYEGSLYRRIQCEATLASGERHLAWCYVAAEVPSGAWPIPSGRW
jgi:gamma-glutamylcyclotransferase (GGCT)/AIG2-like uncharacterized protein YtfP